MGELVFPVFRRVGLAGGNRAGRGGVQQIEVLVRGGYSPAVLRVERGVPVRIVFAREESAGCSEELVMPAFGIRRFLPPHERTTIEFTPQEAGRFEFTCGMGMLRGAILVEEGSGEGSS